MPDQDKSILNPPEFTPQTADEVAAQRMIRWAARKLRLVAIALRGVKASLPELYDGETAEAMGEHRQPQSLTYSLIGSIECCLMDDIEPAIAALDEAAELSAADLYAEWLERQQAEEEASRCAAHPP